MATGNDTPDPNKPKNPTTPGTNSRSAPPPLKASGKGETPATFAPKKK